MVDGKTEEDEECNDTNPSRGEFSPRAGLANGDGDRDRVVLIYEDVFEYNTRGGGGVELYVYLRLNVHFEEENKRPTYIGGGGTPS